MPTASLDNEVFERLIKWNNDIKSQSGEIKDNREFIDELLNDEILVQHTMDLAKCRQSYFEPRLFIRILELMQQSATKLTHEEFKRYQPFYTNPQYGVLQAMYKYVKSIDDQIPNTIDYTKPSDLEKNHVIWAMQNSMAYLWMWSVATSKPAARTIRDVFLEQVESQKDFEQIFLTNELSLSYLLDTVLLDFVSEFKAVQDYEKINEEEVQKNTELHERLFKWLNRSQLSDQMHFITYMKLLCKPNTDKGFEFDSLAF